MLEDDHHPDIPQAGSFMQDSTSPSPISLRTSLRCTRLCLTTASPNPKFPGSRQHMQVSGLTTSKCNSIYLLQMDQFNQAVGSDFSDIHPKTHKIQCRLRDGRPPNTKKDWANSLTDQSIYQKWTRHVNSNHVLAITTPNDCAKHRGTQHTNNDCCFVYTIKIQALIICCIHQ